MCTMKALWTYWNRFVFYHSLTKCFSTWWVFSFFYFCFCFPITLGMFKQHPPTHCCISQEGERVFDQPPKVGISFVRKCSLLQLAESLTEKQFQSQDHSRKQAWAKTMKAIYCPVLKLTGRFRSKLHFKLNFSMWIILLYGSHFLSQLL